ncbi:hypothetical protein [Paracoccus beibuensis]|uniref:hypothetical protein n=1 Tax=Paracoccus beibuensis TaxID=547602 RepID=UPI00224019D3|nr:hypothetical protein [Paracoccus beibuensis]
MEANPPLSYAILNGARGNRPLAATLTATPLAHGRVLLTSPDTPTAHSVCGENEVTIVGLCLHIDQPATNISDLAHVLAQQSESNFLSSLDRLTGRWVVVRCTRSDLRIYGDATHMLKICYDEDLEVSSNIRMLRELQEQAFEFRQLYLDDTKAWKGGVIGRLTPAKGIRLLTPNTSLSLITGKVARYFPRSSREECANIPELVRRVSETVDPQLSRLTEDFDVLVSMTAGVDSRYTLAALGEHRCNFHYFSYSFNNKHHKDATVASAICHQLGLRHTTLAPNIDLVPTKNSSLPVIGPVPDPAFDKILRKWCWYNHHRQIAMAYHQWMKDRKAEKKPLHLRSNLFEIGRAYWPGNGADIVNVRGLLEQSTPQWLAYEGEFQSFADSVALFSVLDYGYNPLDIFYWEHRCATWVSEILQESDFSFQTHSLANCRATLALYLAAPRQDRISGSLFKQTISQRTGPVSDVPFA